MSEYKQVTVELSTEKTVKCTQCGQIFKEGYELRNFSIKKSEKFESLHFCSINCLARWVGEQGWFYELTLRGLNTYEDFEIIKR